MFDFKGISHIKGVNSAPGRTASQTAPKAPGQPASRPGAGVSTQPTGQTTRPAVQPQPNQPQQAQGQNFLTSLPLVGQQIDRVISQVLTFFFGNKKDVVDEREKEKRRKNDMPAESPTGQLKVEETTQPQLGGGQ